MPRPIFRVRLRLLRTDEGGRRGPIFGEYRGTWNLGGETTLNGGRLVLDDVDQLAPGAECLARIEPHVPELWTSVHPGSTLPMQEGARVVGHATVLEIVSRPD